MSPGVSVAAVLRVDHGRLAHQLGPFLGGSAYGQLDDGQEGAVESGALGGSAPTGGSSTVAVDDAGTSTAAPAGRLSIRPRFGTVAWIVRAAPVTMLWMTCGAYSVALRLGVERLAGRQRRAASAAYRPRSPR